MVFLGSFACFGLIDGIFQYFAAGVAWTKCP